MKGQILSRDFYGRISAEELKFYRYFELSESYLRS